MVKRAAAFRGHFLSKVQAFLLVVLVAGTALLAAQDKPGPQFAGSETCALCHEELHTRFLKSAHGVLEKSERLKHAGQACESCHGPGMAHAEKEGDTSLIFSFVKATKRDQEAACLECHGMQVAHAGTEASLHLRAGGPSCLECHTVHASQGTMNLLKSRPVTLCLSCHAERESDFRRPFHHKVLEGGMTCVDCHQPHGGALPRQLKSAVAAPSPCVRCHADKSGPFVYEHASVRFGDCVSCHVPHGSGNPKMLVRNTVQALCLECHSLSPGLPGSQPPAFHDMRTARFQSCTTCHVKIHGSNASRVFLR